MHQRARLDASPTSHYIPRWPMNLLLLFSALLSAITGMNVGGARVPVAAEQVVRAGAVTAVAKAAPARAARPANAMAALAAMLAAVPVIRFEPYTIAPFASRRRE